MAVKYILARTMKEAHAFAHDELGLEKRSEYRVVTSSGTIKSVRGRDLYLVPGWKGRADRFKIQSVLRWTRMNVIDIENQQLDSTISEIDAVLAEEPATPDEACYFLTGLVLPDSIAESEPEKKRRRSRCNDCGNLHFRSEPCPEES